MGTVNISILSVPLYITHLLQLYAQIYWLAEFGDVSCLQFNYLRVETLTQTWEDLVGHLSDNLVGHLSDICRCEV